MNKENLMVNRKTGRVLWCYPSDIFEFFTMYDSGKYYQKEIMEWFGITRGVFQTTIKNREMFKDQLKGTIYAIQ